MKNKLSFVVRYFPELIAGVALSIALILTAINAFSRYLLGFTYVGKDEVVAICFAWTVFMGAAAAYKRNMHYGLDFLANKFPSEVRKYVDIITTIITVLVIGSLTYFGMILTTNTGWKIMTATRISYVYLDAGMLVGFILMTTYSIADLVKRIRVLQDTSCDNYVKNKNKVQENI